MEQYKYVIYVEYLSYTEYVIQVYRVCYLFKVSFLSKVAYLRSNELIIYNKGIPRRVVAQERLSASYDLYLCKDEHNRSQPENAT